MKCYAINGDLVDKASFIMNHFNNSERFSYELIESEIEANTSVHYQINDAIKELGFLRSKINNLGKNNLF